MDLKQTPAMPASHCAALLEELTDVLGMLDQELARVHQDPQVPILTQPVTPSSDANLALHSDDTSLNEKDLEALIELLIERQLPRVTQQLKRGILREVLRILPADSSAPL